jgi:hypothetical protein
MSTKTLDEKLRERADKRLKDEIKAAIGGVAVLTHRCNNHPKVEIGQNKHDLHTLYGPIETALFESLKERNQQDAVDEFLREVERTAQAINELKNS